MDVTIGGVMLVPLLIGLVEVLKRAFGLSQDLAPVAAVLLGIGLLVGSVLVAGQTEPQAIFEAVITGLAIGLAAVGLYSGAKNVVGGGDDGKPTPASR